MLTQLEPKTQAETACVNPVFSGAAATRKHLELLGGDEHKFSVAFSYVNSKTGKTGLSNNGTQYHSGMVVSKAATENAKGHDCYIIPNAMKPGKPEDNNCVAVRALYIDVDDGRDWAAMNWHAEPSFVVVTERGFHGYWLVSDCTVEQFTASQKALIQHYNSDKSINNPARLLRLAGTVQHKHGNAYQTSLAVLHGSEKRPLSALLNGLRQENTLSKPMVYPPAIEQRLQGIATAPEGERNTTLFNGTAQLLRDYPNQRDTILDGAAAAGLSAGLSADEVADTVNRASLSQVARSPQQKEAPRKRTAQHTNPVDSVATGEPLEVVLERALVGLDLDSLSNVQLRNDAVIDALTPYIQWDVLANRARLGGHTLPIDLLYKALIKPTRGKLGEEQFKRLMAEVAAANPYYSHADYLRSLTPTEDTEGTLNQLYTAMGISNPFEQRLIRLWLISAVARALEPGCKADGVLTLAGPQYLGKTILLSTLFGNGNVVNLQRDDSLKDTQLKQTQVWCAVYEEVDGFNKKETASVKAHITEQVDTVRIPFAKEPTKFPRHMVFAGTVNPQESGFLKDPTGNRRWWTINVTQEIDIPWVSANRDSVWAAALALYQAGEQWWLTRAELLQLNEHNEQHEEDNGYLGIIREFMESEPGYTTSERVILTGLKLETKDVQNPAVTKPVAAALNKLGYVKGKTLTTINGKRAKWWTKLDTNPKQLVVVQSASANEYE